jgi:CYTH domain
MDRSLSTNRTRVTPPISRVEPVKLPSGRELEIKFKTDAAGLKLAHGSELLSTDAADAPRQTLRSVYFDTPAGDLRKQGMVLRVRKMRRTHIMGLKWARPLAEAPFSRTGNLVMLEIAPKSIPTQIATAPQSERSASDRLDGRPLDCRFQRNGGTAGEC